jgi:beta-lactam-binding protein with PASTA domain
MFRLATAALGIAVALAATACGSTRVTAVPNVTGERLDVAEDTLDASKLRYHAVGGGAFGIAVRSHWLVCSQRPAPNTLASSVTLHVARSCPTALPDVVGESLAAAEDRLDDAGIPYRVDNLEGEEIVVDSFWTVCDQSPVPGTRASSVELSVAHDCWEYGE